MQHYHTNNDRWVPTTDNGGILSMRNVHSGMWNPMQSIGRNLWNAVCSYDRSENMGNQTTTPVMRDKIFTAFWNLYRRKPINKITVREIIELTPCNRSTFYAYFLNIYDVLDQFEESLIPDPDTIRWQRIIEKDTIRVSVEYASSLYKRYKSYYALLLGPHGDPAFRERLELFFTTIIKKHLHSEMTDTDFTLDYVIHQVASSLISGLQFYYQRPDRPSAQDIVTLIVDILGNGISDKLGWSISVA